MPQKKTSRIIKANFYAGFDGIARLFLKYWKNRIVKIGDNPTTLATIADINHHLLTNNVVIFLDHHYAFDAVPAGLVLLKTLNLKYVTKALVPFAVHLAMGVNQEGLPSRRYQLRTILFHWLIEHVHQTNPNIHFFPVARKFELENPKLKAIVDDRFPDVNAKYLKEFTQLFTSNSRGCLCLLAPMAGIAFPEKPTLHPRVYHSLEIVQRGQEQPVLFYFVSAYPRLQIRYHYVAPLLTKHIFVAQGPFYLSVGDYEQARGIVTTRLHQLRQAENFTPPDYSLIKHK